MKQISKRKLSGVVVSDKMDKTVIVNIDRMKKHSRYLKYYQVSRKFKAHDENNQYKVGDIVTIEESRPISKEKKWIVTGKLGTKKVQLAEQESEQ